jgi:hypothetical protein
MVFHRNTGAVVPRSCFRSRTWDATFESQMSAMRRSGRRSARKRGKASGFKKA